MNLTKTDSGNKYAGIATLTVDSDAVTVNINIEEYVVRIRSIYPPALLNAR